MDLPVEKWKLYINQKLTSLQPLLKEELCPSMSLRDSLLLSLTLLHPEDEEYLLRLSRYYCVKKDPKMTLSCKEEGNKWFRKKEYRTAAVLYSRALSHAEAGSPEMAVCYANHSAALFHLGQFEVCLEDIKRAQGGGYPEELLPKLLLRKADCLLSLGRFQEVTEALSSIEEKMSADHHVLLSQFNQLKLKACKGKSGSVCQPAVSDRIQKDLEPWEESSRISCASASVSLNFSACKGRHLVAAKDILPGEILVSEEAFVSVLCPGESLLLQGSAEAMLNGQPANEDLHCHHCLKQLLSPVPCQGCSYAKYCSHACAQLAWRTYHSRECSFGGLLLTLGVFCHIALRSVLVAGFAEVSALIKQSHTEEVVAEPVAEAPASSGVVEENSASSIPGCDADGRYSSSYQAIFCLLPHTEKHSLELRLLCSLSVAALCKRLGEAGLEAFISGKSTPEDQGGSKAGKACPEWEVPGEAMLRHMLQLQCNAQAVSALRVSRSENGPVASSKQVRVATALYPVVSLLNHSCEPNTSVTFSGRTAEVRALQSIPRGQEILHCYGPHRCRMGAAKRRKQLLSQYFFECRCLPCLEELQPVSGKRASSQDGLFHCPACHKLMQQGAEGLLHCSSGACKVRVHEDHFQHQLSDLRLQAEVALELLQCGHPDQSMELLLKCRLDAKRFLSPAHLMVGEIEDSLAQAYVTLGKWQEAAGHLRSSIQAVEAHYGPSSIEAGQELFKLAQILFNGHAVPEALHTIQEAENVLSRHLGPQSTELQELQEMKACLEELLGGGGGTSVASARPKMFISMQRFKSILRVPCVILGRWQYRIWPHLSGSVAKQEWLLGKKKGTRANKSGCDGLGLRL
nr:SET and MYND domain-containing protein 4 isoform X3 [Zootoca vivipara]XP_034995354.1 SET and MYND domain-containing protein 4 isoform X3 [Zootoca vivipara]